VAFDGTPHFTNGAALVDATAYATESGRHLTISDSSGSPTVSANSNDFTVGPAALDSFSWSHLNDQTAGDGFLETATAYDAYGNVKTNYTGAATVSSNLSSSAKGCGLGGAFPCSPSVAFDGTPHFTNGAALVDATAYATESGRHLTISDSSGSPTVSANSNDFTVGPAALDSFSWSHLNDQTAGDGFLETATAYDAYGNVKTNYTGAATVSSNLSSSAKGCGLGGAFPCSPSVAFDGTPHFTNGAALVDATAYATESGRHLTISDSSGSPTVSANSNDFTVGPAALDSFSWSHLNDQTAGAGFSATATAYDAYGNVKTNDTGAATVSSNLSSSAKGCGLGGAFPCSPSVAFDATPHFTNGAALVDATAYATESGRHLTLTDPTRRSSDLANSNDFTVGPAALDSFSWSHLNDQTA